MTTAIKAKDLKVGQRIAWGGDVSKAGTITKITKGGRNRWDKGDVHVRWDDESAELGIYGRDETPVYVID